MEPGFVVRPGSRDLTGDERDEFTKFWLKQSLMKLIEEERWYAASQLAAALAAMDEA